MQMTEEILDEQMNKSRDAYNASQTITKLCLLISWGLIQRLAVLTTALTFATPYLN